jgi:hypothetical protein
VNERVIVFGGGGRFVIWELEFNKRVITTVKEVRFVNAIMNFCSSSRTIW